MLDVACTIIHLVGYFMDNKQTQDDNDNYNS